MNLLAPAQFERLRQLDTCTASNAIERFNVRLRNEGFIRGSVLHCLFPGLKPMLGYAVTGTIRSSFSPMKGCCYYDRLDWWEYVTTIPEPRIIVLEDIDPVPGFGAFFGEIHAHISHALGCAGYITNGSVRDVDRIESMNFHLFASGLSVSHAYAHIVEFGEPVELGGLKIKPGDLLHGDLHGVHCIPHSIAAEVPNTAAELLNRERELIELCQEPDFSLAKLSGKLSPKIVEGGQDGVRKS